MKSKGKVKILYTVTYLDAMAMSCVSPGRRRKRDKVVREVDKDINQIPMPYGIGISISPSLDPLVI